jgi:hypothetical protein
MSNEKLCHHCNTKLTRKRKDARFCCAAHRAAQWRLEQNRNVSIKLHIPKSEYLRIKAEADMSGLLVNAYMLNKVTSGTGATA